MTNRDKFIKDKPMSPRSVGAATEKSSAKFFWGVVHLLVLAFAVWLVSPLIVITTSDYLVKNSYGLRLALGLLVFIMYVGKWSFDVFAPQGLARKVSRLKTAALIIYILVVISFMIYIVAQSGIDQDETESDQSQIQIRMPPGENQIPDEFAVDL
jgi:thiol:disulfide interchange protein